MQQRREPRQARSLPKRSPTTTACVSRGSRIPSCGEALLSPACLRDCCCIRSGTRRSATWGLWWRYSRPLRSRSGERDLAFEEVYAVVRRIPRGRVMNYGQIAGFIRHPLSARAVGWAMQQCPQSIPWQRVVNAQGGISTENMTDPPGLQRLLLESEGVHFNESGKLSMTRYRWNAAKKQTKKK